MGFVPGRENSRCKGPVMTLASAFETERIRRRMGPEREEGPDLVPLLLLPPIPPSIRVFSNDSTLHIIFEKRLA